MQGNNRSPRTGPVAPFTTSLNPPESTTSNPFPFSLMPPREMITLVKSSARSSPRGGMLLHSFRGAGAFYFMSIRSRADAAALTTLMQSLLSLFFLSFPFFFPFIRIGVICNFNFGSAKRAESSCWLAGAIYELVRNHLNLKSRRRRRTGVQSRAALMLMLIMWCTHAGIITI